MNIEEAQKLINDILTVTQKEGVDRAVADVQNGALSLLALVENLRPKLTAREADLRANGVNELCAILLRLESSTKAAENFSSQHHIDSKDCDFLLNYLLARVEDSGHLADLLITAIHHLLITYYGGGLNGRGKSLESDQLDRALTVLFENNGVQSYGQRDRHLLFAMFEHLLDTHCAQLRQLGPQRTVMAFLHSAQGEREPRVLLSVFRLHQKVASQLRLGLLGGQQSQLDLLGKKLQAIGAAEEIDREEIKVLSHRNGNFAPSLLLPVSAVPIMACEAMISFDDCEEEALEGLSDTFDVEHLSECTDDSLFKYPMAGVVYGEGVGNRLVIPLKVRAPKSKNFVVFFIIDSGAPHTSFSERTAVRLCGKKILPEVFIQETKVNCRLSGSFNEKMKNLNLLGSQFMLKSDTTLIFSPFEFKNNYDKLRIFYLTTFPLILRAHEMASARVQDPSVVWTHQPGRRFQSSVPTNSKLMETYKLIHTPSDRSTTTSSAEPDAKVPLPNPEALDAKPQQQPTGSTSEANVQEEKPGNWRIIEKKCPKGGRREGGSRQKARSAEPRVMMMTRVENRKYFMLFFPPTQFDSICFKHFFISLMSPHGSSMTFGWIKYEI